MARLEERKFLGFSISNDGSERRIAPKALDKFKGQIRDMTRPTRGFSLQQLIKELKPYIVGWRGYFGFCQTPRSPHEPRSVDPSKIAFAASRRAASRADWSCARNSSRDATLRRFSAPRSRPGQPANERARDEVRLVPAARRISGHVRWSLHGRVARGSAENVRPMNCFSFCEGFRTPALARALMQGCRLGPASESLQGRKPRVGDCSTMKHARSRRTPSAAPAPSRIGMAHPALAQVLHFLGDQSVAEAALDQPHLNHGVSSAILPPRPGEQCVIELAKSPRWLPSAADNSQAGGAPEAPSRRAG